MSNPQRGSQQSASIRGKALRLIDYLRELARLRTALIRSVKESAYEHILWVHSIPRDERWCFTQAWGIQAGAETDAWIKVRKYNEPRCPDVPKICECWVDSTSLRETNSRPRLSTTIVAAAPKSVTDANAARPEEDRQPEYRTLVLKDHPKVESEFGRYVEQNWKPWSEVHRKWQAVQSAYSQLFQIHQAQQRLGEEYELVVGLGFLQWVTPDDQVAERHLLTAQAALSFDASSGTIIVGSPTDGTQLAVELDMLDVQYRPAKAETIAQESLKSADNDPWDRATVDPVLKSLAQFLAERGEYERARLEPWPKGTADPRVTFAPALILRRRSARGLIRVLEKIRVRIAEGEQIPPQFGALAEIPISDDRSDGIAAAPASEAVTYFPLPTNEEQRQIVDRLGKTTGVLVQGPPGTGKSHTIANLICHLLATGQRILVTAKTPRALQVLYDKLPPEIQPLCISLLGATLDEKKSVERSVDGILSRVDRWDDSECERKVRALESQIDNLRRERILREAQLRKFREAETYEHAVVDGTYRGTAAAIARQLADQAGSLGWILDNIGEDVQVPLTTEEVCEVQSELANLTAEHEVELRLRLPTHEELPDQQAFERLARFQRNLSERVATATELLKSTWAKQLGSVGGESLRLLVSAVESLSVSIEQLLKRQVPWVADATTAVLANQDHGWRELHRITKLTLEGLTPLIPHVESLRLEKDDAVEDQKLRRDAAALKKHFDGGGTTGWLFFKPRIIRDLRYVLTSVRIDGQRCNNRASVTLLAELMEAKNHLDQAWEFWNGRASRATGPLTLQVAEIQQQFDALSAALDVSDRLREIRATFSHSKGVTEPAWNDVTSIGEFIQAGRAVLSVKELAAIERQASQYISHFRMRAQSANEHPISKMVSDAIANYDPPTLRALRERLNELHAAATRATVRAERIDGLRRAAPILADRLTESAMAREWPDRLRRFEEAWRWSRAKGWLEHLIRQDDVAAIEARVKQVDSQINVAIASLAALRAWKFCYDRMKDEGAISSHLKGWQQAMRRAGKLTGKYASKHLRDAQRHWEEGRTAVPAWVMPLYRVYETVDPQPGLFDVIIVDEASQCGPEALPLLYLGKRVLVVGDDKQISPEAVGSSPAQVHSLASEYLYDFQHADAFDLVTSLFDQGDRRFGRGSRIVLREHFRCVPEIIRFSNDLCYSQTPLIPLRQYPPQRLEPLCSRYVPGGYREGEGSNVINRPEGEALVKEVVKCCADPRYASATMGVITLQGNSQAHLIQQMLLREMDTEQIERRRLICGEPYSFQGDERDVIFLSMVAAPNSKIGALTKAADERRFNVAASRARDQMWLFHSVTRNDLGESDLRRRLLEHFENPVSQIARALGDDAEGLHEQAKTANRRIVAAPPPFDSWFEVDVALAIASRGYRVVPQFPVANKRIDLVVEGQRSQLAVECDGDAFHGLDEYEHDTERQRILERCGWRFWRVRESEFYANRERALEKLWVLLSDHGIRPVAWKPAAVQTITQGAQPIDAFDSNKLTPDSPRADEFRVGVEAPLANAGSTTFQQSLPFAAQSSPEGTCSQAASQALPFCDDGRNRSGTVTSHPKLTNDERLAQQDSQPLPATLHADNAICDPSLVALNENSKSVTSDSVASGQSQDADLREAWQMKFSDWKELVDLYKRSGDKHGLRRIGGFTSDFAHRYRVAEALKQGKPVPQEVLDDYPDLAGR